MQDQEVLKLNTKRISGWFNGKFNFTYSVATGKSSSADQGFLVATTGASETISELFLSWDKPLQASANLYFNLEKAKDFLVSAEMYWMIYLSRQEFSSSQEKIYETDTDRHIRKRKT